MAIIAEVCKKVLAACDDQIKANTSTTPAMALDPQAISAAIANSLAGLITESLRLKEENRLLKAQLAARELDKSKEKDECETTAREAGTAMTATDFDLDRTEYEESQGALRAANKPKRLEFTKPNQATMQKMKEVGEMLAQLEKEEDRKSDASSKRLRDPKVPQLDICKILEDQEFQFYVNEVYKFIWGGVISWHSSEEFPDGVECLMQLYTSEDLEEYTAVDLEDEETATTYYAMKAEIEKASAFLQSLGLDPVFIRDLKRNSKYNYDDGMEEEYASLYILCLTDDEMQKELVDLRKKLEQLEERHAAYPLKARLMAWFSAVIVTKPEVSQS